MPVVPDPQPHNSAGAPEQTSGASARTHDDVLDTLCAHYPFTSLDYSAIEQRAIAASLQQDDSAAGAPRLASIPLSSRYIHQGTTTGRMEMRHPLEQSLPRRNPWPFDPQANLKLTQEDFIMSTHNNHFIVNRIDHKELEEHLDRLLEQYSEGTAEGDDLKACFEGQSTLTVRDEETAAHFKERCAFLAACYASNSFPPHRDMLKRHVLSMLTSATRDALGAYGVVAEAANGNGYSVLNTGRSAVFKELEAVVKDRVNTVNDATPSSLTFFRDAPPKDWVDADRLGSFIHDKQAHDVDLRREMALVETLDVGEEIKHLMRMYLKRAGDNTANALRYYHTASLLNVFRRHADDYTLLLFYSYKVRDKEVRGLQYSVDAGDYIEGFGGY